MNDNSNKPKNKKARKKRIIAIVAVLLLITTIWTIWSNVTIGVTHYSIASSKIPKSFDGYKIAVVSDFHNAQFGDNNESIIELVQNESPDIIAITGDLVDSSRTDVEIAASLVKRLVEIAPCYYVTGNHEAWIGDKFSELEERLTAEGVEILHNDYVVLEKGGEVVQLAGIDDPDFKDSDTIVQNYIEKMQIEEMELGDEYTVLLSHRPETFNAYVLCGVDLVLAGHAHGGQFRLPLIGGLVAPNQGLFPKYDAGLYTEDQTTMIVSRGIGNSIIPVRFNNRPELVIVELNAE